MKRFLTFATLILALSIASCKKQGPVGPTGSQGPQGPQGNANVQGGTATVNFVWNASTSYGTADMDYNAITQSIVDNGAVLCFMSNGNGGWIALPYTDYSTTGVSISYYFVYSVGAVRVYFSEQDLNNTYMPTSATFKVVAIAAAQKQAHRNTNWKNYDEVMAVVNEAKATN